MRIFNNDGRPFGAAVFYAEDKGGGDDAGEPKEPEAGAEEQEEESILSSGQDKGGEGGDGGDKGKPGGEPKPDAAAAVTPADLKVPEGYEWDEEMGKPFLEVFGDAKLTPKERAQKVIDMIPAFQEKFFASMKAAYDAENKKLLDVEKANEAAWKKAALADPEYGGEAFAANKRIMDAGRDKLATPGAVEVIERFGFGNHPEILRMFYRAGKLLGEDGFGKGGKEPSLLSDEEVFYGKGGSK
jgi:hypothetical protein